MYVCLTVKNQPSPIIKLCAFLVYGSILFGLFTAPLKAANKIDNAYNELLKTYNETKDRLDQNNVNTPFHIISDTKSNNATGRVYAIVNHPYAIIRQVFKSPSNWCNAAVLHINVKACTTNSDSFNRDNAQLSLYIGDADYLDPEDAFLINYHININHEDENYFHTHMSAEYGPLDSKDFHFDVEAIPVNETSSFISFSYSVHYGWFSKFLLSTYLATTGRHKVGFTQEGTDRQGNPVYIKGIKGVVERNTMRYFLAFRSYLDIYNLPEEKRFDAGLAHWFAFTKTYRRQLYELNFSEYKSIKEKEYQNQIELQLAIQQINNTNTDSNR